MELELRRKQSSSISSVAKVCLEKPNRNSSVTCMECPVMHVDSVTSNIKQRKARLHRSCIGRSEEAKRRATNNNFPASAWLCLQIKSILNEMRARMQWNCSPIRCSSCRQRLIVSRLYDELKQLPRRVLTPIFEGYSCPIHATTSNCFPRTKCRGDLPLMTRIRVMVAA